MSQRGTPRRFASQPDAVYRRRRLVVGTLLAVVVMAVGLGATAALDGSGGASPASAAGAGSIEQAAPSVVAVPGDSLWGIARQHHGDVDFDRYLDALIELNGGTAIEAGQLVRLP